MVVDDRPLCGGTAHVERKDLGLVDQSAVIGAHQGARHGPRLDQPNRKATGDLGRRHAAVGRHHEKLAAETHLRRAPLQRMQVAIDHGLGVGVDRRRRPSLELLREGTHFRRNGQVEVGKLAFDQPPNRLLVGGIGVGMEKTYGEGLDTEFSDQSLGSFANLVERQLVFDPAIEMGALRHLGPMGPWHDRLGEPQSQIAHFVAFFLADIQGVPKSLGDQHAGYRALALYGQVRDKGCPMNDHVDPGDIEPVSIQQFLGAAKNRRGRILGRGQDLVNGNGPLVLIDQCEIGECAADVDAETMTHAAFRPLFARWGSLRNRR